MEGWPGKGAGLHPVGGRNGSHFVQALHEEHQVFVSVLPVAQWLWS